MLLPLAVGCARVTRSPAPRDVRTIIVLPVDDRAGSALYADAPPLAVLRGDAAADDRITAPQLLQGALRDELHARGFVVAAERATPAADATSARRTATEAASLLASGGPDQQAGGAALDVHLWRWDPSAPSHVLYVDVALDATLVAPDGRVLWTCHVPATPIDGGAASSVTLAYPQVARTVAQLVLRDSRRRTRQPRAEATRSTRAASHRPFVSPRGSRARPRRPRSP